MIKQITKTKRDKIIQKVLSSYSKVFEKLRTLLESGENNLNDTVLEGEYEASEIHQYGGYDETDLDFIIGSCGGNGDLINELSDLEKDIFDLLLLAR